MLDCFELVRGNQCACEAIELILEPLRGEGSKWSVNSNVVFARRSKWSVNCSVVFARMGHGSH